MNEVFAAGLLGLLLGFLLGLLVISNTMNAWVVDRGALLNCIYEGYEPSDCEKILDFKWEVEAK